MENKANKKKNIIVCFKDSERVVEYNGVSSVEVSPDGSLWLNGGDGEFLAVFAPGIWVSANIIVEPKVKKVAPETPKKEEESAELKPYTLIYLDEALKLMELKFMELKLPYNVIPWGANSKIHMIKALREVSKYYFIVGASHVGRNALFNPDTAMLNPTIDLHTAKGIIEEGLEKGRVAQLSGDEVWVQDWYQFADIRRFEDLYKYLRPSPSSTSRSNP